MAMREPSATREAKPEYRIREGEDASSDLEAAADSLLRENGYRLDGIRLYTEPRLSSRIAEEFHRLPEARKDGLQSHIYEYLLDGHVRTLCDAAGIRGLRRTIFALHKWGLTGGEIASLVGVSRQMVSVSIHAARRQVRLRPNKYAGLQEVYWREVHRYVYRKPRSR